MADAESFSPNSIYLCSSQQGCTSTPCKNATLAHLSKAILHDHGSTADRTPVILKLCTKSVNAQYFNTSPEPDDRVTVILHQALDDMMSHTRGSMVFQDLLKPFKNLDLSLPHDHHNPSQPSPRNSDQQLTSLAPKTSASDYHQAIPSP